MVVEGQRGNIRMTDAVQSGHAPFRSDHHARNQSVANDADTQPIPVAPLPAGHATQSIDDPDTGPIPIGAPWTADQWQTPDDDRWPVWTHNSPARDTAGSTSSQPWWNEPLPNKPPRSGPRQAPRIVAAAAVITAAVGIGAWLWLGGAGDRQQGDPAPPPPVPNTAAADAQNRLLNKVASQYPPGSCTPAPPPAAATAMVVCKTSDRRLPAAARYVAARDQSSMRAAFDDIVDHLTMRICPGKIQSPGPWRRNATPEKISGTLVCGAQADRSTVAWTTDADLLVSSIQTGTAGPTLEQLYAWWSAHS
jgi:hypothetical protein